MADDLDRAADLTERERTASIARARHEAPDMPGPAKCIQCGDWNDRALDGYGVCSDCVEVA